MDTLPSLPAKPSPVLEGLRVRAAASLWDGTVPCTRGPVVAFCSLALGALSPPLSPLTEGRSYHTEMSASRKVERKHISLMCVEVTTWRMRNSPSFSTFYVDWAMFQHFPQINTIPTAPPRGRFS